MMITSSRTRARRPRPTRQRPHARPDAGPIRPPGLPWHHSEAGIGGARLKAGTGDGGWR